MASSPHMAPGAPWPPDNASLLEWAEAWHDRGYKVIPLIGKKPIDDDWPHLQFGNNLLLHFSGRNGKHNLGVALGENRLGDADLDCLEATTLWREFFGPPTNLIYGRDSKAFSHWFYHLSPPISTKRYQIVTPDPTTGKRKTRTILELRCLNAQQDIGLQSMVPGSIHPAAKERIRFEADGDGAPADVAADVLTLAAGKTAAAVLLACNFPVPQGGRHDTFLGLAGFLLQNSGWPVDEIVQFHCAIYRLLWLQNANLADARTEVETTASQISQGQSVTGFPRLCGLDGSSGFKESFFLAESQNRSPLTDGGSRSGDVLQRRFWHDSRRGQHCIRHAARLPHRLERLAAGRLLLS